MAFPRLRKARQFRLLPLQQESQTEAASTGKKRLCDSRSKVSCIFRIRSMLGSMAAVTTHRKRGVYTSSEGNCEEAEVEC